MKKSIISILTAVMMVAVMSAAAFSSASEMPESAEAVKEVPDIGIVMEGTLTSYKNVPLSVKGNTLLPLREFLVYLGVPDSSSNFKYDSKEKAVEVTYEQIEILLYIGKTGAYINGEPVTLNTAPVLYNNYTYIPARSVAEAFGKKVVWDGASRSILICAAEKYDVTKEILTKSNEAALRAERYKMDMAVEAVHASGLIKENIEITAQSAVDKKDKKMQMDMLVKMSGLEFGTGVYFSSNASYNRSLFDGNWYRTVYTDDEYDRLFEAQSTSPGVKETLCAGLSQVDGESGDEITLSGDVYLADLYQSALAQQTKSLGTDTVGLPDFDTFKLVLVLDKNTYLVKSMTMDVSSTQIDDGLTIKTDIGVSIRYGEYDGDFEVTVPEDVIKNAADIETTAETL